MKSKKKEEKEFRLHGTSRIQTELKAITERDVLVFREGQRLSIVVARADNKLDAFSIWNAFSTGVDTKLFDQIVDWINK